MNAQEYYEWLSKFEAKHTTDECFTPPPPHVYEAIADWVADRYGISKDRFVRPFHPGGNYEEEDYTDVVVVDNPPFSIISKISKFYMAHGVKFFLFAPALSTFGGGRGCCSICTGAPITYANGAKVSTSFVTNLEDDVVVMSAPSLYKAIKAADDEQRRETTKELPKYSYPSHVVTAANVEYMTKHDTDFSVRRGSELFIRKMDAQVEQKKSIYGGGYLLSEKAAAEKAAAEKAAAEKAAAVRWEVSEREKELIAALL